ncbi:hypothetical protein ACIBL6_16170 [Streptomyces sp. NPDC050400]|uniref:hypothetical protein n=1 Tax=Streptomyces sp. NPDC050400 TaxID=3365610 RepID=UPI0037939B91
MGYDMYSATDPDEHQTAAIRHAADRVEELRRQYANASENTARTLEPQLDAAWDTYEKARTGLYFRLNIWGMGTARQLMSALDMLTDTPFPTWPTLEAYSLTDHPDNPNHHPAGPERQAAQQRLTADQRAYLDAVQATMDWAPQTQGIASYKLLSNDGWLVTEREITDALTAWEKAAPHDREEILSEFPWWNEWISFLEYNAKRGGFRVY